MCIASLIHRSILLLSLSINLAWSQSMTWLRLSATATTGGLSFWRRQRRLLKRQQNNKKKFFLFDEFIITYQVTFQPMSVFKNHKVLIHGCWFVRPSIKNVAKCLCSSLPPKPLNRSRWKLVSILSKGRSSSKFRSLSAPLKSFLAHTGTLQVRLLLLLLLGFREKVKQKKIREWNLRPPVTAYGQPEEINWLASGGFLEWMLHGTLTITLCSAGSWIHSARGSSVVIKRPTISVSYGLLLVWLESRSQTGSPACVTLTCHIHIIPKSYFG